MDIHAGAIEKLLDFDVGTFSVYLVRVSAYKSISIVHIFIFVLIELA